MLHTILIGLLMFAATLCSGQNYLITRTSDTIYIQGELETNHEAPSQWNEFTANGANYQLRDIKCISLGNDIFLNIRKRVWKRVVNGKINVYARNEKDTIPDKKGNLKKVLFIQRGSNYPALKYSYSNFIKLVKNDSLRRIAQRKVSSQHAAKGMIVAGTITLGAIGIATFFTIAIVDPDIIKINAYVRAGIFFLSGFGNLIAASKIKNTSEKMSLAPIYYYNAH